jgi:predicted TIM-barrel fold metal-dependent hydrolase
MRVSRTLASSVLRVKPQRRAILYDNAARFLRLDARTIRRHHDR